MAIYRREFLTIGAVLAASVIDGGIIDDFSAFAKSPDTTKKTNAVTLEQTVTAAEHAFNRASFNLGFNFIWKDLDKDGQVKESELVFPDGYLLDDPSLVQPALELTRQAVELFSKVGSPGSQTTPEQRKQLSQNIDSARANYLNHPTPDNKEYLRIALRNRELFGRPFAFQTVDFSTLPVEIQKVAWKMAYQARPRVENIFMIQRDPHNLEYRTQVIKSGSLEDNLAFYFWGEPWCPTNEDSCSANSAFPKRITNGGHWPPNFTEEMVNQVKNGSDDNLKSEFIDRFIQDGKLTGKSINNNDAYKKELEVIAQVLTESSAISELPPSLKKFMKTKGQDFLNTSSIHPFWESDQEWIETSSPLELTIGFYETYNSPYESTAMMEMYVGLVDQKNESISKQFNPLLKVLEAGIAKKLGPVYSPRDFSSAAAPILYVDSFSSGDGIHHYIAVAYQLPNDPPYGHTELAKKVIILNHSAARYDYILTPMIQTVFDSESQQIMSLDGFNLQSLGHELSHNLGPFPNYTVRKTRLAKDLIGKYSSALEEIKADTFAVSLLKKASEFGLISESQVRSAAASVFASNLRGFCFVEIDNGKLKGDAHGLASVVEFFYLYQAGVVTENKDGTYHLNLESDFYSAFADLVYKVMEIERDGDKKAAEELVEHSAKNLPRSLTEKYMPLLREMPKEVYPIYDLIFSPEVSQWGYEWARKKAKREK